MANDQRSIFRQRRLNTRLLEAVFNRNLENVKSLLAIGASPDTRCRVSLASVCHLAAFRGSNSILEELLKKDADISARDSKGLQPHHLAAKSSNQDGSLQCLRTILDKQSNLLNSPVKIPGEGEVTLDDAVLDSYDHNHNDITTLVNEQFKDGSTALDIAVNKGHIEIVKELLDREAVISEETRAAAGKRSGGEIYILVDTALTQRPLMKPLQMAVLKGNVKEVENCLRNLCSEEQLAPNSIHLAIQNDVKNQSNKDNYNNILQMLLEKSSSDINKIDGNQKTPLYLALEGKWMEDVDLFLEHGADISVKCKGGETVIHAVARSRNYCNLLKYLLETQPGSNVLQIKNDEGYTPLYLAIKAGCLDCVEILLENDCYVDSKLEVRDLKGAIIQTCTLLHAAIECNKENDKMLQLVMSFVAAKRPNIINERNNEGLTAVDLAAKMGAARCLDILFQHSTDSNTILFNTTKVNQDTALHHAAKQGQSKCVDKILSKCEELIDMPDSRGLTALIHAARGGYWKCAEVLLKRGANLAAKDTSPDRTAIDIIMAKVPNAVEIIEDMLDGFVGLDKDDQLTEVKTGASTGFKNRQHRQDSKGQYLLLRSNTFYDKDYKQDNVKLDYKCLVAGTRQLEVIETVSDCKYDRLKERFFLHPLVKTFLLFKWKQTNTLFNILLFTYIVHIASVTGLALCTYVYQYSTLAILFRITIWVTMLPVILMEIISWLLNAKIHSRFETFIKWLAICTTFILSVTPTLSWSRYLASMAILLAWMELLLFYSMSRRGGFYVLLFFKVAINVFQVLSSFLFLIVGFWLAFLILFNGKPPFPDPFSSFAQVLSMIAELNYDDTFKDDASEELLFKILGRVLYIGFFILVVMVMMNLIVGLSVNVVTEHEGRSKHLAMQGSFLSLVDEFCYNDETNRVILWLRQGLRNQIEKITSHQPTKGSILEKELRLEIMNIVNNKSKPHRPERIHENIRFLMESLTEVAENIRKST